MQYTQQQPVAPQFNKATNEITEFFRSHDFDRDGFLNPTEYRYFLRDSLSNGDRPSQFVLDLIDDTVSKQRSNIDLQSAVNSVMNLKAYLNAPSSSYMQPTYAPQQQSFQQMNNSVFPQTQFAPPPNYVNPFMMPDQMNLNPFQQQTQAPMQQPPMQMYAPIQMQTQAPQQIQVPPQQQHQQQVQAPPVALAQQPQQQQQTRVAPQPPMVRQPSAGSLKQPSQMAPQPTPIAKQAAPQPMVKQPSAGSLPIPTGPRPAAAPVQTAAPNRPASTVVQKPVAGQFKQPLMVKIPPRPLGNQQASPPASRQTQGTHHVSKEEKRAFVEYLNTHKVLSEDPDMKSILPINAESNQLFDAVSNGVLFCKLLDAIKPGTIPASSIKLNPRNQFEKVENHVRAINAAKQLGCTVVNIGPEDLLQGKAHLIMGLMWQMIRMDLLAKITIQEHPEICTLIKQGGANGMSLQQITQSTPEQVLMHWVNHHLAKAGYNKPLTNFSEDIKDASVYSVLLNQVAPDMCSLDSLHEQDVRKRAQMVVENARALGCNKFITPTDILSGNSKLNLAFVADLFNKRPGLELPSMEDLQRLKAANSSLAGVISEAEERLRQILADRDLAYRLQQEEIALYRERKAREQEQLAQQEAMLIAQQKEEELMFQQQKRLENLKLVEQEQALKEQQKQEELRYEQQRAEERRRQQWQQLATQEGVVSEAQRRDQMVRDQREIERRIQQENMMRAEQAAGYQQQHQQQARTSAGYGGAPYSVSTYTTTTQSVATDPTFMFSGTSTYSRRPGMVVRRF